MNEDDEFYETEEYEFELLNSSDSPDVICLTLYCYSPKELTPSEYAQALIAYAKRIESIALMNDIPVNSKN